MNTFIFYEIFNALPCEICHFYIELFVHPLRFLVIGHAGIGVDIALPLMRRKYVLSQSAFLF